ncbi:sensor histidine kinase [uncultured Stenotrophomonas sp.]|uniref:sensor histidine kinase n=1 Tax=uncultured Stenotrophomonas sp. TaxID=165438 RepID=UPI0028E477CD|nr:sensor histidine kinase [uncultured Stenotrophomonas sp.]
MSVPTHGITTMRPRARLIGLLGEELISDEPVALVELVKNAFDADASQVRVSFELDKYAEVARIVIEDDGVGMSIDTVLGAWFEPGTINKKASSRSPGGRPYQGAKGIGRFASARLGDTLLLETKAEGFDAVSVFLTWGEFSDSAYLDDVKLDYSVGPSVGIARGTRLTIEGLDKEKWSPESFQRVHSRLSRLISPFSEVDNFSIELSIPGHPDISGTVDTPQEIQSPKYRMAGQLDSQGLLHATIEVEGSPDIEITAQQLLQAGIRPECGPFEFEIRAWDRDRDGLEPIAKRLGTTVALLRSTLNIYCGVSVYRDGFRVYPYGEPGNDWLQLDLRSRQRPGQNLANNQIVAAIRISREHNEQLQDRSAREGMIKNQAHDALETWFKAIIQRLEEARYRVRPRQQTKQSDALFEAFDVSPAVAKVKEELGKDHPVTRLIEAAEVQVNIGVERVQEVFSRLLLSAGLGHMVDVVLHEIGAPLGKINRQVEITKRLIHKEVQDPTPYDDSFKKILSWSEQISGLRKRLEPHTAGRRGKATSFNVREEIELTLSIYDALLARQKIAVTIHDSGTISAKMSSAAFGQVVANLIDNAIYWSTFKNGIGGGGRIDVYIDRLDQGFSVAIHDDGPGVAEEDVDRIFESYVSNKPNGMGLGLYIARLVIEQYGRVVYEGDSAHGGANFIAKFERGVGL